MISLALPAEQPRFVKIPNITSQTSRERVEGLNTLSRRDGRYSVPVKRPARPGGTARSTGLNAFENRSAIFEPIRTLRVLMTL